MLKHRISSVPEGVGHVEYNDTHLETSRISFRQQSRCDLIWPSQSCSFACGGRLLSAFLLFAS